MAEVRKIPDGRHANYSASPGFMVLSMDAMKPVPSQPAAEGTVAHLIAAECLSLGVTAESYIGQQFESDGFTFKVDRAMVEHIQVYLDNVGEYAAGAEVLVEVEVNYSAVLGVPKDQGWGTSDVCIVRDNEIGVHDLKFGRGEDVDATDNDQMMLYALGLLDAYGDLMGFSDDTKVVMAIHQPRIKRAPKEATCTVGELKAFGERAKLAVHSTKAAIWGYAAWKNDGRSAEGWKRFEGEYLKPGEKQCRWCPAKSGCSAVRNVVAKTVMAAEPVGPEEFEAVKFVPKKHIDVTDNEWLAASLAQAPLIEGWLKALYVARDQRMQAGQHIRGYKLVTGQQGDRTWTDAVAVEHYLKTGIRLPDQHVYSRKLVSPAGAEALTKGDDPLIGERQWKKLQDMIKRADGKPTVVPESDPRPAIEVRPVEEEFDDLSQQIADDIG